ncbi:hypothetical protein [Legionella londiniensis]|uniref:Uncharacterized protein n=1 Tax=Legionella londiniensis TaxID=45068 RepID=A0A0W0VIG0_9GAMM|nr:hypothetical protein [Legionella londiniensis]KTD19902.1 hypothetical protein Llon_2074 [Legionella londiniensis]STX94226.1 Uncharacterised protein [Legionella londiniensis]
MITNTIDVGMDEYYFTNKKDAVLVTKGITTCIAFVVQGHYYDEDANFIPFCGLFHWSGFTDPRNQATDYVAEQLQFFFEELREQLDIEEDDKIIVTSLLFIGGEKSQFEGRELILSGTEKEVETLKEVASGFNYEEFNIMLKSRPVHNHYLTSGELSLAVEVGINQFGLSYEHLADEEEIEDGDLESFDLKALTRS